MTRTEFLEMLGNMKRDGVPVRTSTLAGAKRAYRLEDDARPAVVSVLLRPKAEEKEDPEPFEPQV